MTLIDSYNQWLSESCNVFNTSNNDSEISSEYIDLKLQHTFETCLTQGMTRTFKAISPQYQKEKITVTLSEIREIRYLLIEDPNNPTFDFPSHPTLFILKKLKYFGNDYVLLTPPSKVQFIFVSSQFPRPQNANYYLYHFFGLNGN
jgi:hypothetical protein